MKTFLSLLLVMVVVLPAFAGDILTTTENLVFQGKVTKIKDCMVVFKSEGNSYQIPANDIYSIQFERANDKVLLQYLELSAHDTEKCLKGNLDAEFLHKRENGHFILGFLFGPFALIGAAMANPSPLRGIDTYSKSTNTAIFSDPEYLSCYRKKARRDNAKKTALGWAASTLVLPILYTISYILNY